MSLQSTALCDGVTLYTVRTDRFKTALLTLQFFLPLQRESAAAYSLLSDVLMRGTRQYPSMLLLNRRQDELYSLGLGCYVQKVGNVQVFTAEISCIDDSFAFDGMQVLRESIGMLRELVYAPYTENGCFCKAFVQQEQKNLLAELLAEQDNKELLAGKRFLECMYGDDPYAISADGTPDALQRVDAQSLWHAYEDMREHAPMCLFYVGGKSAEEVAALCRELLPLTPRNTGMPQTHVGDAPPSLRRVTERQPMAQAAFRLGFRSMYTVSSGQNARLGVLNELLGGVPNGRLFRHIREQDGLCYACGSQIDARKGLLTVYAGTDPKNLPAVEQTVMQEIATFARGEFTDEELQIARRALCSSLQEVHDTPASLLAWYPRQAMHARILSPQEVCAQINAVTREEIMQAAATLQPDTLYCLLPEEERNA